MGEAIKDCDNLKLENFSFSRAKYGLPPEFEVEVETPQQRHPKEVGVTIFRDLIHELSDVDTSTKRKVQCNLCSAIISRSRFGRHMKLHPNEKSCPNCGLGIKPIMYYSHLRNCVSDGKSANN